MNKQLKIGVFSLVGGIVMFILAAVFVNTDIVYMLCRTVGFVAILIGPVFVAIGLIKKAKDAKEEKEAIKEAAVCKEGDNALTGKIVGLQIVRCLFFACAVISVVMAVFRGFGNEDIVSLLVLAALAALFGFVAVYLKVLVKDIIAKNVIRDVLASVFEDVTYHPNGHIPENYIRSSNLGFSDYNKIEGSDYVKGLYRGLRIEMCDLTLNKEETVKNDEGNDEKRTSVVFKGFWLVCDFGKELSDDVRILERFSLEKKLGTQSGIVTDNDTFNQHFEVRSSNEEEAFYLLTPHMMEYILEMDKKADGKTNMNFSKSGKVQIAIVSKRNAFEIKANEMNIAMLRGKFLKELRYVTDIIDELRLTDTLYKRSSTTGGNFS